MVDDRETGIGRWSDAEFVRAVHRGIGKNGEDLYPAFPYTAYAPLSTDDVLASVPTFQLCDQCRCGTPATHSFSRSTSGTR
jgi:hypothetical protein